MRCNCFYKSPNGRVYHCDKEEDHVDKHVYDDMLWSNPSGEVKRVTIKDKAGNVFNAEHIGVTLAALFDISKNGKICTYNYSYTFRCPQCKFLVPSDVLSACVCGEVIEVEHEIDANKHQS